MNEYRTLQLTNSAIGAVSVGANMPLGTITRKVCCNNSGTKTFDVTTSSADTVMLNEKGYYYVNYSASVLAAGAGIIMFTLEANGQDVYSVMQTVASGDTVNISLPYEVRVFDNCLSCPTNNPLALQIKLSGVGVTSGASNLTVEKRRG